MMLRLFLLMLSFSILAQEDTHTPSSVTVSKWTIETVRNSFGYYVHSRVVTFGNIKCKQTRMGISSLSGKPTQPSHVLWEPECELEQAMMQQANIDVLLPDHYFKS